MNNDWLNAYDANWRWKDWLEAQKRWAASARWGDTVHTPQSIFLCRLGAPTLAVEWTGPSRTPKQLSTPYHRR